MAKLFLIIGAFLCSSLFHFSIANLENVPLSFDGFKVIRAFARNEEQGMALIELQRQDLTLDFWTEPSINHNTDIMASNTKISSIISFLEEKHIEHSILIQDVGKLIANQASKQEVGAQATMSWTEYHNLTTVYQWFDNLTDSYSYVDVINIGKSYEGRDVKVVRISKDLSKNRPAIFIDSLIHAREWISLGTVTYIINELLTNPSDNTLLDNVDFYFLPVINPDGYAFTHSSNRMWRKTRSVNGGGCIGVDANRNFDYQWNSCNGCSSGSCVSDGFRGAEPFSESETDAMRAFIEEQKATGVNFQSYISIHSYGQYFMLPWGFTSNPPQDFAELNQLASYVGGNITAVYGKKYITGSSSTAIYPTDGTSQDWAYGTGIFKYVFTAELRDTGSFGFLLPPAQIIPTGEETWAGFKVVVKHIFGK